MYTLNSKHDICASRFSDINRHSLARHALILIVVASLSACGSSRFDVPSQDPADVEDRIIIDGEALPLPEDDLPSVEPLSNSRALSPVVKSLLSQARNKRRLGDWSGAAMLLERALRIEPRNAMIWSRLADIRYDQQLWSKAIQLAAKSNTLAAGDIGLKRQNWILMANSYEQLGDPSAANRVLEKLNQQFN